MSDNDRIAYLNGQFVPQTNAKISPLDRGFLFGDGVYEVIRVHKGFLLHWEKHIQRLNESLKEIRIAAPHQLAEWQKILTTLIEKNGSGDQWIYLQVTRGADIVRELQFPKDLPPTIFITTFTKSYPSKDEVAKGLKASGVTDIRWKFCHIKTTARLAYVLMCQEAKDSGADEAIIINNGYALEGTSSNFMIVRHGVIITPQKSSLILSGVTRDSILALAEKNKIPYRETKVSERDLQKADELWITSALRGVYPVVEFNGEPVGDGKAGPLWDRMWDLYANEIDRLSLPVSH
jgi:D-alanine transaminase